MTVCVLGATGMLGSMLVDYLSQHMDVVATVRKLENVKKIDNVEYRQFNASQFNIKKINQTLSGCNYVINAIGAIPQRVKDYSINVNLPFALSSIGIPTIQITTDCVFSGWSGNYVESSKHDYTDEYGRSKSLGEFKAKNIRYLRCSIVGRGPSDKYSLLGWFLSQPLNAVISGYVDYQWNGITTLAFAKICEGIIERNHFHQMPQIQHVVPFNSVSKDKLLRLFAYYFKRTDIEIVPTKTERVNRTLATNSPYTNSLLWNCSGYHYGPAIESLIEELAEYLNV